MFQEDLRRDEVEEVAMEEEEENPFGVHSPASVSGTLAGISTHPNPHQAIGSSNNQASLEIQEELPPRPLHRLHRNNFRNLIHNYGFENTPVGTYRPIGPYLAQEKPVQEKTRGARKINT